jgi:predicted transcriptional regulator
MARAKRFTRSEKFRIDEETKKMIDEVAERLGLSRSAVIRLMIRQGYYRIKARNFQLSIGVDEI